MTQRTVIESLPQAFEMIKGMGMSEAAGAVARFPAFCAAARRGGSGVKEEIAEMLLILWEGGRPGP